MAERNSSSRTSERGGMGSTPDNRSASAGNMQQNTSGIGQTRQSEEGLAHKVKERASAQLNTQKDRATEGLGTISQAVRQSTQQLRDQKHETIAGYVEQAANQIDRLSQGLKNKDVGELARDAQRLAQKRPAIFVGSAFAIGLVGARFLKSSPPQGEHEYERGGQQGYGARGYETPGSRPFSGGYQREGGQTLPSSGTSAGAGTTGTTGTSGTSGTGRPGSGSTRPGSSSSDIPRTGRS